MQEFKKKSIPDKTQADTKYCIGLWLEWCCHQKELTGEAIPDLNQLSATSLAMYLTKFIYELRKRTGEEFPPSSLVHIISGIQRHIRITSNPSIDFFNDAEFADFRSHLDSEMKRLQRAGLGSNRRKAEPLTISEEELLWSKGALGSSSPQVLVDTILFMNGLYFALRSGVEHRQLRFDPCQIKIIEKPGEIAHLQE